MSNINKAVKDIKKKLSFNDYDKPAKQQNHKTVKQPTSNPVVEKPTAQNKTHQVYKETRPQNVIPTYRHDDLPTKENKIKSTYYLTAEANNYFTEVYINRLKNNKKTDRSTLICEAIKFLYKNEF